MRLRNPAGGEAVQAERPRGPWSRSRGLLGSPVPAAGRGLLLRTRQVHSLGMRFPFDAVYMTGSFEVLEVRTLVPGRVGPLRLRARWVLEMAEGEATRMGLAPGCRLEEVH